MDFKETYDDTCSTVGKACWTGNVDALKSLIATGRQVNVKDNRGWFPLHAAAYREGQPECLEILLQHEDCDVNWKTFEGQTALYLASKIGNIDAIRLLLRHGADVNLTTKYGWTPLHAAAYREGQPECLEILLQHEDCDVNWKTFEGQTALYLASKIGNIDAIRLLLRHGADVNLTTNEELSPLWEGRPVHVKYNRGWFPLHAAAYREGQPECLEILLQHATEKMRLACMHALVAAGADVNQQTYTGDTPLHFAAERGNTETVTFLLDNGADMSVRTHCGHTPVFIASQFAKHECLKIMLEMADQKSDGYAKRLVDAMATDNTTPLFIAAQAGSAECVKLLLDRGANPDIACEVESLTCYLQALVPYVPLQMAVRGRHPSCVELLVAVTTEVKMDDCDEYFGCNHPVCLAITDDNIRCIKILLENGYSWKKIYKELISLLHGANISMDGETEFCYLIFFEEMSFNVAHYFLRLGIMKPSLNNTRINTTTFDLRIRTCSVDKFLLLLKYGANPTVLDSHGVNQVAVDIIRNFDVDFIYALIKYGTKLQVGNELWNTGMNIEALEVGNELCNTGMTIKALVVMCLCSNIPTDEEVRTKKLESGVEKIRESSWGLRHACRVKIVRQLITRGKYTTDSVNTLGLPTILEDYILYKEFDDDFEFDDDVDFDDMTVGRTYSLGTAMREMFRKLEEVDSKVEMLMAANEKEFQYIQT